MATTHWTPLREIYGETREEHTDICGFTIEQERADNLAHLVNKIIEDFHVKHGDDEPGDDVNSFTPAAITEDFFDGAMHDWESQHITDHRDCPPESREAAKRELWRLTEDFKSNLKRIKARVAMQSRLRRQRNESQAEETA